ncbi:MAG: hypothetical protein V5788_11905 [Shewanella sp.]
MFTESPGAFQIFSETSLGSFPDGHSYVALMQDNTIRSWGLNSFPESVQTLLDVIGVASSHFGFAALIRDGRSLFGELSMMTRLFLMLKKA